MSSALAQCGSTQTVDLVTAFDALPVPANGASVPLGSAWSFRNLSVTGPGLVGGLLSSVYPTWQTPGQPFNIPCVGPKFSPTMSLYAARPPTVTGVQCHPGYSGLDNFVLLSPQRPITVTGISVPAEVVGNVSDGVIISVGIRRATGDTTLIAPTLVPKTASSSFLLQPPTGVLPITVNPGESLWTRTNLNGDPFEDWAIENPTFTISGGPIVIAPPLDASPCPGGTLRMRVVAAGSGPLTYQWMSETTPGVFVPVTDGPAESGGVVSGATTPTLTKTQMSGQDTTRLVLVVTNACGTSYTTAPISVVVPSCSGCPADFDGSGGTPDATDIDGFFTSWLMGDGCADTDCSGGTPDSSDIDAFFTQWLAGGC